MTNPGVPHRKGMTFGPRDASTLGTSSYRMPEISVQVFECPAIQLIEPHSDVDPRSAVGLQRRYWRAANSEVESVH